MKLTHFFTRTAKVTMILLLLIQSFSGGNISWLSMFQGIETPSANAFVELSSDE